MSYSVYHYLTLLKHIEHRFFTKMVFLMHVLSNFKTDLVMMDASRFHLFHWFDAHGVGAFRSSHVWCIHTTMKKWVWDVSGQQCCLHSHISPRAWHQHFDIFLPVCCGKRLEHQLSRAVFKYRLTRSQATFLGRFSWSRVIPIGLLSSSLVCRLVF